jgi:hypothetical protein
MELIYWPVTKRMIIKARKPRIYRLPVFTPFNPIATMGKTNAKRYPELCDVENAMRYEKASIVVNKTMLLYMV